MAIIDNVKDFRELYIGGSDIPTLLNLNKNKTMKDLLDFYTNKIGKTFYGNEYSEYGNLMEYKIRDYVNLKLGINATPQTIKYEDRKIRCNTDGYDKDKNLIIEIKTNNGKHSNTFDYEVQMQLYMWAFNVDKGLLVEYTRPKHFYTGLIYELHHEPKYFNLDFNPKMLKIKEIKRSNKLIEFILSKIKIFWEEVEREKENEQSI